MIRCTPFACMLISALIISCSGNTGVPQGILPPQKMQAVLYDILKVDEYAGYRAYTDSAFNTKVAHTNLYQTVFNIHHTTREAFKRSLEYYEGHPTVLKIMFDSLQSRVDRELKTDSSINAKFPHKPDTMRRLPHPLPPSMLHPVP